MINDNAYMIDLLKEIEIGPILNVSYLYSYSREEKDGLKKVEKLEQEGNNSNNHQPKKKRG